MARKLHVFPRRHLSLTATFATAAASFHPKLRKIPNVKHAIVVASGKGGVGKSTVAVNTAIALSALGNRVGLLDADLYGPSIPQMMHLSLSEQAPLDERGFFTPQKNYNIDCMSISMILPQPNSAVVWRGLMVTKAIQQLLFQTSWPALDYLIIDTPPGTGDTHLTIAQNVALAGVVIVSTGQSLAQNIVQRGVDMFTKVNVPILGWIRNMSWYECSSCHHRHDMFAMPEAPSASEIESGPNPTPSRLLAAIPLLGDLPCIPQICHWADKGLPVMLMTEAHMNQQGIQDAKSLLEQQKQEYTSIASRIGSTLSKNIR